MMTTLKTYTRLILIYTTVIQHTLYVQQRLTRHWARQERVIIYWILFRQSASTRVRVYAE